VDSLPVEFWFTVSIVDKDPLSWTLPEASSTPAGEAETSSAGEHLVKE
jgi:hypothetical protein